MAAVWLYKLLCSDKLEFLLHWCLILKIKYFIILSGITTLTTQINYLSNKRMNLIYSTWNKLSMENYPSGKNGRISMHSERQPRTVPGSRSWGLWKTEAETTWPCGGQPCGRAVGASQAGLQEGKWGPTVERKTPRVPLTSLTPILCAKWRLSP